MCDGDRLVGILTDRDITVRATARGSDPATTRVREVMTQETVYCFADQDVETATQMMEVRQIRRVPVLNREKRLVGIVSLGDLAVGTNDPQMIGETLECVSDPAEPQRLHSFVSTAVELDPMRTPDEGRVTFHLKRSQTKASRKQKDRR